MEEDKKPTIGAPIRKEFMFQDLKGRSSPQAKMAEINKSLFQETKKLHSRTKNLLNSTIQHTDRENLAKSIVRFKDNDARKNQTLKQILQRQNPERPANKTALTLPKVESKYRS